MMLSKKDLASIRELMKEETSGMKEDISELKEEVSDMKEDISGLKEEVSGIKEEIWDMKEDISELKEENVGIKVQISNIEKQMVTKEEFGRLEREVHELRDYSHGKFMLIENEVLPKISVLFEMTDSYVKQTECRNRREQLDEKLNCIDPLKAVVKSHSDKLAKHDEMLGELVTNAG